VSLIGRIRRFALAPIGNDPDSGKLNNQVAPFAITSVGYDGSLSTFRRSCWA
jgi:hypothetical protein